MVGGVHKACCFFTNGIDFEFKCPHLQLIIKTLFEWFNAYYILYEDRRAFALDDEVLSSPPSEASEGTDDDTDPVDDYHAPEGFEDYLPDEEALDVDLEKRRETYEKAAGYVMSHQQMLALFFGRLNENKGWPTNDKALAKQVDKNHNPDPWVISSTSRATSKRSVSELTQQGAGDERRSKRSRSGV
ncbi:hypothetical protein GLOTRDRAFT_96914 [Gloeophyllum trabeum ATCC 11539]|uniref:Uncharacterized protein n=1 Tax=Gloeophyllum trabeum (strain ATCC 11539 / FP-39264 / Madison 617) TaxID=670483 RepID=S7R8M3_GLOTA|nr:uncharacterized protein GLOTRDRAFT_96914 [Gloeophyllum trabeum ATCC 11539]EPQ50670.1 hypothetical protein GLOTRDRAFT_96914 [Gloeophyllum trabeum ATCC 11539]